MWILHIKVKFYWDLTVKQPAASAAAAVLLIQLAESGQRQTNKAPQDNKIGLLDFKFTVSEVSVLFIKSFCNSFVYNCLPQYLCIYAAA